MNSDEHDDLLFSMLQECKTLPIFLDHVFGFLNRRTDFYVESNDPNSPVGLPPNLAEQTVKQTFYKWKSKSRNIEENVLPPPAIEEVEIDTESDIPELELKQENTDKQITFTNTTDFTPSECYNGQISENYCWSQTLLEVDVFIKMPDGTTSKDISVYVTPDKITVKHKKLNKTLLEGELCHKCKHLDVIWSINKNKLELHLDKLKPIWWDCLLKSEPKLDVSKLDCTRPYEELNEEAQAKIEELQWNQKRKQLGLPTSDEMKMQEMLKKSWNAEGSPFSGPFDPSAVKFQ